MKKIITYSLLILLCCVMSGQIVAAQAQAGNQNSYSAEPVMSVKKQRNKGRIPDLIIFLEPFSLINGRLKISLEKKLNHPNRYLVLNLNGAWLPYPTDDQEWELGVSGFDPFKKMNGYGIGGAFKQFLGNSPFYGLVGMEYNYYRVCYFARDYYPYEEDGMTFYEYEERKLKKNFRKINPHLGAGIQFAASTHFFIDLHIGMAYEYSSYEGKKVFDDYRGFGYRGFSVIGGINFGFRLKQ